jgi:3-oxoacyl-[acyl-carrier protein] reductase
MAEGRGRLDGKVAVVTGAGSSGPGFGTGKAISVLFAREGAKLVLVDQFEDRARETLDIIEAEGGEAAIVVADLADSAGLAGVIEQAVARFGGVDILVNNSGGPQRGKFADFTDADWRQAFEVVTLNFVRFVREVVPYMRAQQWGRIVGIQSMSVKQPVDGIDMSNGLRPGVAGLMKALMPDLAKDGITINLVLPGMFLTSRIIAGAGRSPEEDRALQAQLAPVAAAIPLGRLGDPIELGNLVAFLASAQASYITGAVYQVDGGLIKSNI